MDLRDKRLDLILQQLEELPTLPAVAVRVLHVTGDDASSAQDVVRLIASDPALTARILQMTRRADRGVRDDIQSVDRAVVMLGFDAVRHAVLAVSVFQALGTASKPAAATGPAEVRRFSREEFWKHCLAVACCAELLAETAGGATPSDAFICGLLHDLGKIALDVAIPKSYARVVEAAELLRGDIADLERTVIGVDHQVAGKRLAERWQLPQAVRDVCWLHGQPPEALPSTAKTHLINLVTLADLLVRQQHLGYSGNYAFPIARQALLAATGVTANQADAVLARIVPRMEPRLSALGLDQASGDELYREALEQANRELGRVSGQLAAKNRRLTQRTHFFDALQQFQSNLRADASPLQVLSAIARTAAGVIGLDRAAVFSLAPAQDYAEAALCDGDGSVLESLLVELPGMSDVTDVSPITEEELSAIRAMDGEFAEPAGDSNANGSASGSVARIAGGTAAEAGSSPPPPKGASGNGIAHGVSPGDGPVLPAGDSIEWLTGTLSPKLPYDQRFWICLQAEGACIGGIVWGAAAGEGDRLSSQAQELAALSHGWSLALRMAQVRDEARTLSEELAEANRQLLTTQDALLRTRALTTVGEMAAGAAHEMNNPLMVISGRSQLLARLLSDDKHKAMATLIHEQSDRLSDIITEMMSFAKPSPPKLLPAETGSLITTALTKAKVVADPADRDIEVKIGVVPKVIVDADQVSAALTEVLANAIHATDPKTGRILIQGGHDPWSGRVVLNIQDNGCGMDEPTLKRAFDPFFSSKPAGRRRGLGLAKALRWVETSGGSIRLESRAGEGTRVLVVLPATGKSGSGGSSGSPAVTDVAGSPAGGREGDSDLSARRIGPTAIAAGSDDEHRKDLPAGQVRPPQL